MSESTGWCKVTSGVVRECAGGLSACVGVGVGVEAVGVAPGASVMFWWWKITPMTQDN